MKKIIDLIKEALLWLGIESEITQNIVGILTLIVIAGFIGKHIWFFIQYFLKKRRDKLLATDLHPYFTSGEVKNATKYYIDTRYQNVPPSQDEEPGRSYIAAARQLLIPLFLKRAFKNDTDDTKYYLVLADSGMGKTTFMINLYLAYKYKRVWFWQRPKHEIALLPMGHPGTMKMLKEMPSAQKRNTILLLDAFDEDNEAVSNYKKRLGEVLDLVWEFREVVITCRTQFFPTSKEEPSETGQYKYGGKGGEFTFQKVYVSVFSERDIKKYLKKRYKSLWVFKNSKHNKAFEVVEKSPNLMMRPMLLNHIEDLIQTNINIEFGYQIYELLIDEWLDREAKKAGIKEKYKGKDYKKLLLNFSKALARDLYLKRHKRGGKLSLKINEIIDNSDGLQLKDIEGNILNFDKYDQGSRSLLNRNAIGEYKFSHKSILEYFLALEVKSNVDFRKEFYFSSDLDTSKRFFLEMLVPPNSLSLYSSDLKKKILPHKLFSYKEQKVQLEYHFLKEITIRLLLKIGFHEADFINNAVVFKNYWYYISLIFKVLYLKNDIIFQEKISGVYNVAVNEQINFGTNFLIFDDGSVEYISIKCQEEVNSFSVSVKKGKYHLIDNYLKIVVVGGMQETFKIIEDKEYKHYQNKNIEFPIRSLVKFE